MEYWTKITLLLVKLKLNSTTGENRTDGADFNNMAKI